MKSTSLAAVLATAIGCFARLGASHQENRLVARQSRPTGYQAHTIDQPVSAVRDLRCSVANFED